jgi:thiol-disulfide isomerase/thioredoxin
MARRKSVKRSPPKRRFTRRLAPHMGRVSAPIDVRSPSDIPKAIQRLKKGPVTIVFVYADWCGHCQRFKPMFQRAVKTNQRDMEAVSVNSDVLDEFNNELTKRVPSANRLEPEGYPDVVIVDNKGKNIGNVPSSASEEDIVSVVSNGSAMVKTPANASSNSRKNNSMNTGNAAEPTVTPIATNASNASNTSTVPITNAPSVSTKAANSLNAMNTLNVGEENATPMSGPVLPPGADEDLAPSEGTENSENSTNQKGGSLFGSLSSAAYTLAPAGILLAGLHTLRQRKSSRKQKGGKRRKGRKTVRRY